MELIIIYCWRKTHVTYLRLRKWGLCNKTWSLECEYSAGEAGHPKATGESLGGHRFLVLSLC